MGRVARAWHQHRNCPGGAWCAAWLTKELAAAGFDVENRTAPTPRRPAPRCRRLEERLPALPRPGRWPDQRPGGTVMSRRDRRPAAR
jgi:hypothetical protein